jgi:hypothetical protein
MRVSTVLGKTDHRRRAEYPCIGSNLNEPSLSLASSSDVFFLNQVQDGLSLMQTVITQTARETLVHHETKLIQKADSLI